MFRPARHKKSRFRPNSIKRDTSPPARPKHIGFDQVQPSEIRFDRRDQNIYVSTKFHQARYVSIGMTTKLYVSTKIDQARYVSTGVIKTFMFRPSSTKFEPARYVLTDATKTSEFRPSSTKRDTFRPARPIHLCFDHVRPSEIRVDRRDQNIYVSTKFDQV